VTLRHFTNSSSPSFFFPSLLSTHSTFFILLYTPPLFLFNPSLHFHIYNNFNWIQFILKLLPIFKWRRWIHYSSSPSSPFLLSSSLPSDLIHQINVTKKEIPFLSSLTKLVLFIIQGTSSIRYSRAGSVFVSSSKFSITSRFINFIIFIILSHFLIGFLIHQLISNIRSTDTDTDTGYNTDTVIIL